MQRPRKRARRASRCSSSFPPPTSFSQSISSPPSSRPSTALAISPVSIGLGIMGHSNEHVHDHGAMHVPALHPPVAPAPYGELASHRGTVQQTPPPLPSQWQTSSYGPDSNQFLTGICQLTSVAEDTAASTIPCVPLFSDGVPSVPSVPSTRPENMMGDYSWALPALPDYSLEEVAHINLRIHLAGRALPSLPRTLASLSSPAIHDFFDAAYALVNAADRFASRKPTPVPESPAGGRGQTANFGSPALLSPVIDTALDFSICLMLHAGHQALLAIFEDLSASLLYLGESQHQQLTPPRTPRDGSFFPPSYNQQQPGDMVNLIGNLVAELDRAFLPLASHTKSRPPFRSHKSMPALTGKAGGYYGSAGLHPSKTHATWQKGANHALVNEMEQRRMRVRGQFKSAERLVGMT